MARYIDADALKERLREIRIMPNTLYGMGINTGIDKVVTAIEAMPTADVAPKSEVARLQEDVDRLQEINNRQVENIKLAEQRVAREIFEEIEKSVALKMPAKITPIFKRDLDYSHGVIDGKRDASFEVLVLLAELKKKYQEGELNG